MDFTDYNMHQLNHKNVKVLREGLAKLHEKQEQEWEEAAKVAERLSKVKAEGGVFRENIDVVLRGSYTRQERPPTVQIEQWSKKLSKQKEKNFFQTVTRSWYSWKHKEEQAKIAKMQIKADKKKKKK